MIISWSNYERNSQKNMNKKLCAWCKKNTVALWDVYDEYSNSCTLCSNKRKIMEVPLAGAWSRHQKVELKAAGADVLQPKNKDGTVNKKFVRAYGTKKLEKEWKTTAKKIEKLTY